jgi:multidrug transporter EmrE-like cation transporter
MSPQGGTGLWLLVAAAVLCNAFAQFLMKRAGVSDAFSWRQWLDVSLLGALALYGVSFALTALVFARLPLSVASPLMAGAIFVLIGLLSAFVLHEPIGWTRLAGMGLIVAGIVLLSRG